MPKGIYISKGDFMNKEYEILPEDIVIEEVPAAEEIQKEDIKEIDEKDKKIEELSTELKETREVIGILMDDLGVSTMGELKNRIHQAELMQLVQKNGMTDEVAEMFLKQQSDLRNAREKEKEAKKIAEMEGLKTNPDYADILEKKEAIQNYILRYGVPVKDAYNALFSEERLNRIKESGKESKKIAALSKGSEGAKNADIKISEAEAWAAKAAGMTPLQYLKYKNNR